MIQVTLPQPPVNYETAVRAPGIAFLTGNPHPTRDDWDNHSYWRAIHGYLHGELRGICAYCASYTPRRARAVSVDHSSIDHFVPKSHPPHAQAYEWTNFRLARSRLNHRKANFRDVLDPCAISNGWFRLSFVTFSLSPDSTLSGSQQQQVRDTIVRLGLNTDDGYVTERARAVFRYADGKLPFAELTRLYPFVATEITAQNFDVTHLPRFKMRLANPQFRAVLIRQGWVA